MHSVPQSTQTLATLSDNPAELFQQLKSTHHPVTLTVDGQAKFVIQEAAVYQRLLDLAALGSAEEGVRQGLADIEAGRTRPAREFFEDFRKKHGT